MRFQYFLILCLYFKVIFGDEFFPTHDRYLIQMLNLKQRDWTRDGMTSEVQLLKNEKILVKIKVPSRFYLFERQWRKHVEAFIMSISPKIEKIIRSYASDEFLSVFEPKYDLQWDIYLHNSLYGYIRNGKLSFKKGFY